MDENFVFCRKCLLKTKCQIKGTLAGHIKTEIYKMKMVVKPKQNMIQASLKMMPTSVIKKSQGTKPL